MYATVTLSTLLWASCSLHLLTEGAASQDHQLQQEKASIVKRSASSGGCSDFLHIPNTMAIQGEVVRKIGNGGTPQECMQSCLEATDIECAAAQIQLPATCYITGYKLRNNYFSTHFQRTCDNGPQCFSISTGTSGGFTEMDAIPSYFQVTPQIQSLYCMAKCEQMQACVGFDLRKPDKYSQPSCVFLDLGEYRDFTFDLYIRRC